MRYKLLTVLLIFILLQTKGQYSSPFSQFGLGMISNPVTSGNASLGGIAAGYASPLSINCSNPASYANAYLTTFEAGGFMEYGSFKTGDSSYNSGNGSISHISLLMPIKSTKWGLAMGMQPYSQTKLQFSANIYDSVLNHIALVNTHDGSMYKAFVGTGYKIKNFSFGLNIGLMWGGYSRVASYYVKDSFGRSFDQVSKINLSAFYYQVGLQYTKNLSKNDQLIIGLSGATNTTATADQNNYTTTWQYNSGTVLSEKSKKDSTQYKVIMPGNIDIGFTLTHKKYLLYGMDFKYSNWSVMQYNTSGKPLQNRWSVHGGFEFKPALKENAKSKKYFNSIIYRAGGSIGKSEQNISNTLINTYSLNLGLGLPVRIPRIISYCNIGFEMGGRGMDNRYANESYYRFNFFFTFADKWFTRTKFE